MNQTNTSKQSKDDNWLSRELSFFNNDKYNLIDYHVKKEIDKKIITYYHLSFGSKYVGHSSTIK